MKYARLTKEQFEELHEEFINFLASQQIDKNEWEILKKNKPEIAEQELDIFSDLIWEGALQNANFIENFAKNHIFLFRFDDEKINVIMIKSSNTEVNFMEKSGLEWLGQSMFTPEVEIRTGAKKFEKDRNYELFELIKQGGILSQGELYTQIYDLLNSKK